MLFRLLICFLMSVGAPVRACDIALLLAVDVSGSVDAREYRVQMDGLAAGLRDGVVVEALARGQAAVSLMQWTGEGRQAVVVPWMRVRSIAEAETMAVAIEQAPRRWNRFSTAIGEALLTAHDVMRDAPDCQRYVVDVSGDGLSNEGPAPRQGRDMLRAAGITVNAIVIETDDSDLTAYFWENVITGSGAFVVTANGFEDYPERIRQKLVREVTIQVSEHRTGITSRKP
ncbi:DUF1194 domain-containing protein [Shimia sp.]|uniref:DUF1194 domain-containing protein n=1 Tax=Shimia sp. TaxID=1954381 RepID=UPI003297C880